MKILKIEDIHYNNKFWNFLGDLNVGTKMRNILNKEQIFTIKNIYKEYGWVAFKETEQLPQETLKLLDVCEVIQ